MEAVTITIGESGAITDVNFVQWILNEIEDRAFKRQQVAETYAILIQKGHRDFLEINTAIKKRWSMSGLLWIKTQAWKINQRTSYGEAGEHPRDTVGSSRRD